MVIAACVSLPLLLIGLVLDYWIRPGWFNESIRLIWYASAYAPVGLPVLVRGIKLALRGDVFTEFLLMSLATFGAFYLGEYGEGVAVMVFYTIGELLQGGAVRRARKSIRALLDLRPATASLVRSGDVSSVDATTVAIGETVRVMPGERVPLDGVLLTGTSSFDTAALTGESQPRFIATGEDVLAGMIAADSVADIRVTKSFNDSSLSRILELVQNAQTRKAKTELLIRRLARVYTPVVFALALSLVALPYFFVADYSFNEWLYRALVFLVISCPCALVVAIPLGYVGGIGAGSRNGILIKGSLYLDRIAHIRTVVFDKTGTLTEGKFKVQGVRHMSTDQTWLARAVRLATHSRHPASRAVAHYGLSNGIEAVPEKEIAGVVEIPGHGLTGIVEGHEILLGNARLLKRFHTLIQEPVKPDNGTVGGSRESTVIAPARQNSVQDAESVLAVAIEGRHVGDIRVADAIRPDAARATAGLRDMGISIVLMSGDRQAVVDEVAARLKVERAQGDLLPEDKVMRLGEIRQSGGGPVAFVGDGINDAPALASSDVGIAMGGLGSDAAIETADMVIQTDQPSKVVTAIRIGRATRRVIWQNIIIAFAVKVLVMGLGAWGAASLWEAVFADVGVALLAILNAVRIQRMKFT